MDKPFYEYEVPYLVGAEILDRFRSLDFEQQSSLSLYELRSLNGLSFCLYKPEYLEVYEGKRNFDSDELDKVRCCGSQISITSRDLEALAAFLGCRSFPVRVHLPEKNN